MGYGNHIGDNLRKKKPRFHPGLLVAYAPQGPLADDRFLIASPFTIGREQNCELIIKDRTISKRHFQIIRKKNVCWIEDLKSRNGTFLNGMPLPNPQMLNHHSVIRAGQTVFVFSTDASEYFKKHDDLRGLIGPFHTAVVLQGLSLALSSTCPILVAGPPGSGKKTVTASLIHRTARCSGPFVADDIARFGSDNDFRAALFGESSPGIRSPQVSHGLLEQARGGVLFLKNAQYLPPHIQTELRVVFNCGMYAKVGEEQKHSIDTRIVLSTTATMPDQCFDQKFLSAFSIVRIPPLSERVADIPAMFSHFLSTRLDELGYDARSVLNLLDGDHFESLCLDAFRADNVRGVKTMVNELAQNLMEDGRTHVVISEFFRERFFGSPVAIRQSKQKRHKVDILTSTGPPHPAPFSTAEDEVKQRIVAALMECRGDFAKAEQLLRSQGIAMTKHEIRERLKAWNLPHKTNG